MKTSKIISSIISLIALALSGYNFYKQRSDKKPRLKIDTAVKPLYISGASDELGFPIPVRQPTQFLIISNPTEHNIYVKRVDFVLYKDNYYAIKEFDQNELVLAKNSIEIDLAEFNFGDEVGYFSVVDAIGNSFKSKSMKVNHNL